MTQKSHSQAYTLRKAKLKKTHVPPMFTAALFTIDGIWKQPRCPLTDEWIKKLLFIYTMEYYSAIKRNAFESVPRGRMNLEPIIQSEVSQKEKDKYHILMHIYRIQRDGSDEFICREAVEKHREETYEHEERGGEDELYGESTMETYIQFNSVQSLSRVRLFATP